MGMVVDPERVIFDISSDEEVGGDGGGSDDYSWIMELLDEGDGRKKDDSSDDVVVVGEVIMNPSKQNLKSVSNATAKPDDDDDDCVVLEEDPDKPVEVEHERGGDDSDDLLVVSEKGQIACRDYPHPRHLCAKYPFGSTPHERHCDQCHCYVCDTLAPCVYWCTGVAHCHATDKEKYWKSQRQSTRKIDIALLSVPPGPNTSVSVHPPGYHQAPVLAWRSPNYPPQNQRIRQAPIRPCSTSSSPGLPNLARQQLTDVRDKFHSRVVSQQLRNASINVIPRDKRHNVSHMGPQFLTLRTGFKRAGSSGQALATGRSVYNSSSASSVPQFGGTHSSVARWQELYGRVPVGSNKYLASSQPDAGILGASSVSCQHQLQQLHKQPGIARASANYVPTEPEIRSQPNAEIRGANAVSSPHQLHGQPPLVGVSANYAPMEPAIPSQPSAGIAGANPIYVQPQLPRQPSLVGVSANYALMEPEISSQPRAGMLGATAVLFQPQLPRQSRFVDASANYAPMEPQIPSQPEVSVCANSASSEAPAFSLPYANSSPSQPHLSTLPSVLSEFESFISSENAVSSQSKVGSMYNSMYNNPLSSEAQMFSQLYAAGNSTNNLPQQSLVSQLSNQPDDGTSSRSSIPCNGHLPSPARTGSASGSRHENLCRQQISLSDSQSTSQDGYQGENAFGLSFEDFDFGWETNVTQTNNLGKVYNPNPAKSTEVSRFSQLIESTLDLDVLYDD